MDADSRRGQAEASTPAPATPTASTDTSARGQRWEEGGTSDPSPLNDPKYDLRFCCLDNAAYHGLRASFFNTIHRWLMAFVVFFSSTAMAGLFGAHFFAASTGESVTGWARWLAVVPVIAAIADLVIGPGLKAQTHTTLRARYYELLAEVEEFDATRENQHRWQAALHRIYAHEPPITYRAAKAVAYNNAVDHLWREAEAVKRRLDIPRSHYLFKSVLPRHDASYKPKAGS